MRVRDLQWSKTDARQISLVQKYSAINIRILDRFESVHLDSLRMRYAKADQLSVKSICFLLVVWSNPTPQGAIAGVLLTAGLI